MSHTTITLPGPPAGWLTALFATVAAVAVWVGLAHPTQAVAHPPAAPAALAAPADPSVFVGVMPNAPETVEDPAPSF